MEIPGCPHGGGTTHYLLCPPVGQLKGLKWLPYTSPSLGEACEGVGGHPRSPTAFLAEPSCRLAPPPSYRRCCRRPCDAHHYAPSDARACVPPVPPPPFLRGIQGLHCRKGATVATTVALLLVAHAPDDCPPPCWRGGRRRRCGVPFSLVGGASGGRGGRAGGAGGGIAGRLHCLAPRSAPAADGGMGPHHGPRSVLPVRAGVLPPATSNDVIYSDNVFDSSSPQV